MWWCVVVHERRRLAAVTASGHPPLQRELRRPRSLGRSLIANDSLKCIFQHHSELHPHSRVSSAGQYTIHSLSPSQNTSQYRWNSNRGRALFTHRDKHSDRAAFSIPTHERQTPNVWTHRAMRQSASGADWRAMRTAVAAASAARPDLASRGRGCGNRLRRNTRHENNRNSECTSEARRDAVGVSETRINTRLFTYGVRARGVWRGEGRSPAIRTLQLLLCTTQFHPNSNEIKYNIYTHKWLHNSNR